MIRRFAVPCLAALPLLAAGADAARAEPYRLVMGDRITVDYDFLEDPKTATVDLDGEIRLSELGSIAAAGRTLDEVEDAITLGMTAGGFSGVSFVSVEVSAYAPIVVSGYVEESGQFPYTPGLTAGAAVALAGGPRRPTVAGGNLEAQLFAAGRRAADAAAALTRGLVSIAALQAALDGPEAPIALPEDADLPASQGAMLDALLADAQAALEVERLRTATLVDSWDQESADVAEQIALLEQRIAVKAQTVARLEDEVADLEQLRTQGLTTTERMSTIQQRLADDREEFLALQIAQVQAERARALAERDRARFLTTERRDRLDALSQARSQVAAARGDLSLAREELALLSAGGSEADLLVDTPQLRLTLQGPRADRVAGPLDPATPLLPSDILVVDRIIAEDG